MAFLRVTASALLIGLAASTLAYEKHDSDNASRGFFGAADAFTNQFLSSLFPPKRPYPSKETYYVKVPFDQNFYGLPLRPAARGGLGPSAPLLGSASYPGKKEGDSDKASRGIFGAADAFTTHFLSSLSPRKRPYPSKETYYVKVPFDQDFYGLPLRPAARGGLGPSAPSYPGKKEGGEQRSFDYDKTGLDDANKAVKTVCKAADLADEIADMFTSRGLVTSDDEYEFLEALIKFVKSKTKNNARRWERSYGGIGSYSGGGGGSGYGEYAAGAAGGAGLGYRPHV